MKRIKYLCSAIVLFAGISIPVIYLILPKYLVNFTEKSKDVGYLLFLIISILIFVILIFSYSIKKLMNQIHKSKSSSDFFTSAIVNNITDGIFTLNTEHIIESMNYGAEVMFGYGLDELKGEKISKILPQHAVCVSKEGEFYQLAPTNFSDVLKQGEIELPCRRKDGKEIFVTFTIREMDLNDSKYFLIITHDITKTRAVEKMKREFISTVSHELRTPLTSISGSLKLVVGGVCGVVPENALRMLTISNKNCQRLLRLINDILDLEKIELGKMDFDITRVKVNSILTRALEENTAFASEFGVTYRLEDPLSDAYVYADADRLLQAVTNLLSNAAKFSPRGSEVLVFTTIHAGENIRIGVSDKGPGIPEEFKARMFEKFEQADSSDTREKGGTGLGLSITKIIVEKMKGNISFESTSGQGTTFFIDLPIIQDNNEAAELRKIKILYIEDDQIAVKIIGNALKDITEIKAVATIKDAKEALENEKYDLVILDVILPDGLGLDLIKYVSNTPVVVLSSIEVSQDIKSQCLYTFIKSSESIDQIIKMVKNFTKR